MHELAICQALIDQVGRVSVEHENAVIEQITVAVGPLSGVEPELLERAFSLARAGSPAAEARLIIETPPVRVRCRGCGAETDVIPSQLICGRCGDFHTELIEGDELILKQIELVKPEDRPADRHAGEQSCVTHADAT